MVPEPDQPHFMEGRDADAGQNENYRRFCLLDQNEHSVVFNENLPKKLF